MSLLTEIQTALISESRDLAPVLLKLRLLGHRLGVEALEDWVKLEIEGYPSNEELPDYRYIGVSYQATFSGPFGSGIENAPIPSYLIEKYAGKNWTRYAVRQSISGIDHLACSSDNGSLQIEASNLILLLQGKVYENYACNAVSGTLSMASLVEIQTAVRSRALELTLKLESTMPSSKKISIADSNLKSNSNEVEAASHNVTQIIYGNYTNVANAGAYSTISVSVKAHDSKSVIYELTQAGFPEEDAKEFADLLNNERQEDDKSPFGRRAKDWLTENLPKAISGTWRMGIAVATAVLEQAAKRFYGLN